MRVIHYKTSMLWLYRAIYNGIIIFWLWWIDDDVRTSTNTILHTTVPVHTCMYVFYYTVVQHVLGLVICTCTRTSIQYWAVFHVQVCIINSRRLFSTRSAIPEIVVEHEDRSRIPINNNGGGGQKPKSHKTSRRHLLCALAQQVSSFPCLRVVACCECARTVNGAGWRCRSECANVDGGDARGAGLQVDAWQTRERQHQSLQRALLHLCAG